MSHLFLSFVCIAFTPRTNMMNTIWLERSERSAEQQRWHCVIVMDRSGIVAEGSTGMCLLRLSTLSVRHLFEIKGPGMISARSG